MCIHLLARKKTVWVINEFTFDSEYEHGLLTLSERRTYILSKALSSMFVKLHLLIITVYVDRKVDNKVK